MRQAYREHRAKGKPPPKRGSVLPKWLATVLAVIDALDVILVNEKAFAIHACKYELVSFGIVDCGFQSVACTFDAENLALLFAHVKFF
jgi:hypothetical protein